MVIGRFQYIWASRHRNSLLSAVRNSTNYKTVRKAMEADLFRYHFIQ